MTKKQVKIVLKVARILAPKYRFPGYDTDDLVQECFLMMANVISKFDETKSSFESFTYTHLRNRLNTFKRDNYMRQNYNCKYCGAVYNESCRYCVRRQRHKENKLAILCPINLDNVSVDEQPLYEDVQISVEIEELKNIVNTNMPPELREDYLRLLAGVSIPKARRDTIELAIREILNGI